VGNAVDVSDYLNRLVETSNLQLAVHWWEGATDEEEAKNTDDSGNN
jgi:hypothetical protein